MDIDIKENDPKRFFRAATFAVVFTALVAYAAYKHFSLADGSMSAWSFVMVVAAFATALCVIVACRAAPRHKAIRI